MSATTDTAEIRRRAAEIRDRIAERAAAYDRDGIFPAENFRDLHATGLLGLTAPLEYGGSGGSLALATEVITTIGEGDPATALILAMQYLNTFILPRAACSATLKDTILRDAVTNGALINSLYVEPDLGTPIRGGLPATTAYWTGNGWSISGRKIFSTGSTGLNWLLVLAVTNEEDRRIGLFAVPNPSSGLSIQETWDHLGMRATVSHDVVLEDVFVPADHAIGLNPISQRKAPDPLERNWGALLVCAVYQGVAQAARNWGHSFLHSRKPSNLGAALATVPRLQEAFGRAERLLLVNRLLFERVADKAEVGSPLSFTDSGLIKVQVTENAIEAVEEIVRISGNPGISRHSPLERHLRNVLCARIHTPQADSAHVSAGLISLGPAQPAA